MSVAATILTSSRICQTGRCAFAATFPKPIKAPRSTPFGASVKLEFMRDGSKCLIKDIDAAHCFILADHERWVDANDVRIGHRDEATLQGLVEKRSGNGLIQWDLGCAIGNQLDADHQAASAHISDETIFFLQLFEGSEHQ